jgi:hypothetical protein
MGVDMKYNFYCQNILHNVVNNILDKKLENK